MKVNFLLLISIIHLLLIDGVIGTPAPNKLFSNPYTKQVVISTPGSYILEENLAIAARTSNSAMILIAASDVILDLNGKSIGISTTSFTPLRTGIKISNGAENVTICNGTINGQGTQTTALTSTGIYGFRNNSITINNVSIKQCTTQGLAFDETENIAIKKCVIENAATGLITRSCHQGIINDLKIKKATTGIDTIECNKWTLRNISVSDKQSGAVTGFSGNTCHSYDVANFTITNNIGTGAKIAVSLTDCTDSSFYNCIFSNNTPSNGSTNTIFACYGSADCNSFTKCSVQNNNDNNSVSTLEGFWTNSKYTLFDNCSVLDNSFTGTIFGFRSAITRGTRTESCKVSGNTCGKTGEFYGIFLESDEEYSLNNCQISRNGNFGTATGNRSVATGIMLFDAAARLRITNNLVNDNHGYRGQYGFADFSGAFVTTGIGIPSGTASSVHFKGNVFINQGPISMDGQLSYRANLVADAIAGYSLTQQAISAAFAASTDLSSFVDFDPTTNLSIYITTATTPS